MNGSSITPIELNCHLGTAASPLVLDGRRDSAFDTAERMIVAAVRAPPERIARSGHVPSRDKDVVVYCEHGGDVSQTAAAELRASGFKAIHLQGGISAWRDAGLPTRLKRRPGNKWITRARPKIDRIACPWLISRFIEPAAEFIYVPTAEVLAVANETHAVPYDIDGVEFSHEGERCSFDTFLRIYDIHDRALDRLATIVRGADTSRHDLAPQCSGLFAISLGLSANFLDDRVMLERGMVVYDALYVWCRDLGAETHNWPSPAGVERK
ncbi:MAG: chromate resistance protein ChrB domain-containing protein [Xanthobacteraceae bacterium]